MRRSVEVISCDRCKCSPLDPSASVEVSVKIDRRCDAAGSMEDITEEVDLCRACSEMVLRASVEALGLTARKAWMEAIRSGKVQAAT